MSWTITYYSEEVREWIDGLPVGIRAFYAKITERMKLHGPNLGMPLTRAMGEGLFEMRVHGKEGIARVFYCTVVGFTIVVLHGFIKKTAKTPAKELRLARIRLKEIRHENT